MMLTVDTDKATSDSRGTDLRYVNWHNHTTSANTNACKNATTKNETQTTFTIGPKHESSSEDEDDREDHETLLAT